MRALAYATLLSLVTVTSASAVAGFGAPPTNPAAPVAGQSVTARVVDPTACFDFPVAVERVGTLINLRYEQSNCPIIPVGTAMDVPLGTLPAGTYDMRLIEVSNPAQPRVDDEAIFVVSEPSCPPPPVDPTTPQLCLRNGRFSVVVGWTYNPGPIRGFGQDVKLSNDSGAFWFFTDTNYELMVKVLDACSYNGHFWFFAAGLTDVGVDLEVTDNVTGTVKRYSNPIGQPFKPITDTSAFACP